MCAHILAKKTLKCDLCGLCYILLRRLKSHLQTHPVEKPFKYDSCGLCFTQNFNLSSHLRTHSDERPIGVDSGFHESDLSRNICAPIMKKGVSSETVVD